jgi:hypothetical protein
MIRHRPASQVGLVLTAVAAVLMSCDACPSPGPECPYFVTLIVAAADGGALSGVEATVSGSPLACDSTPTGAICTGGGNGPLHVDAPGLSSCRCHFDGRGNTRSTLRLPGIQTRSLNRDSQSFLIGGVHGAEVEASCTRALADPGRWADTRNGTRRS